MHEIKKSSLVKNTIILSLGMIISKGILFIMVPFFSRWLTVREYGSFDLHCTYVTLLVPLITLDSDVSLFRFSWETESKKEISGLVTNSLFVSVANTCVLFSVLAAYGIICKWKLWFSFFVLLASKVFGKYLMGFLRAIKRLNLYSVYNVITVIFISLITTMLIRFFSIGVNGIILGYGIGYFIGNIFILFVSKYWRYFDIHSLSFATIRRLVKFSYPLIPNDIAWWLINASDRTIINFFLGTESNGIYAIAHKLPDIFSQLFEPFNSSWQQDASENIDCTEKIKYFNTIYNNTFIKLLPICCLVLSFNGWFFQYIFDVKYATGKMYVPILMGGTIATFLSSFYGSIQIALKRPKENGITSIIGAVLNLLIHITLVKRIGLFAAALSTLLSQIIVCILRYCRLKKDIKLKFNLKVYGCFLFYLLYSIVAFCYSNDTINVVGSCLAILFVIIINRSFVLKIYSKKHI